MRGRSGVLLRCALAGVAAVIGTQLLLVGLFVIGALALRLLQGTASMGNPAAVVQDHLEFKLTLARTFGLGRSLLILAIFSLGFLWQYRHRARGARTPATALLRAKFRVTPSVDNHSQGSQSCRHGLTQCGHHAAQEPELPRGAISPPPDPPGSPQVDSPPWPAS